jgi:DNA repair protein RadC
MEILVLNSKNEILDRKYYESGTIDGETYVLNMQPSEKIDEITHKTIQKFIIQTLNEFYAKRGIGIY